MKTTLIALLFCLAILSMSASNTSEGYVFDPQEKAISEVFSKYARTQTIETEKQKIASLVDSSKAEKYMKAFSDGLDSNSGMILMEGGDSEWLRIAYHSGYQAKLNFIWGYLMGKTAADEKISLQQTAESGLSGWTEAVGRHSRGQWMNGVLKIQKGEDVIQTFRSNYGFIIGWAFSRGDTAIVIQSQNSHGPYYWQLFDIASGEQLDEFFDIHKKWPEWVIDFTNTQKQ